MKTVDLREFFAHLQETPEKLLDVMEECGEYYEQFDIVLEHNGLRVVLPLHADLYYRMEKLIADEIRENEE